MQESNHLSNRLIALDGGKHHHVFAILILSSSQSGLICSRNFQAQDAINVPIFVGCGLFMQLEIWWKDYPEQMKSNKIACRKHDLKTKKTYKVKHIYFFAFGFSADSLPLKMNWDRVVTMYLAKWPLGLIPNLTDSNNWFWMLDLVWVTVRTKSSSRLNIVESQPLWSYRPNTWIIQKTSALTA